MGFLLDRGGGVQSDFGCSWSHLGSREATHEQIPTIDGKRGRSTIRDSPGALSRCFTANESRAEFVSLPPSHSARAHAYDTQGLNDPTNADFERSTVEGIY